MTMTFMSSPSLYMTSESVTEGHPDKLCDQIADAILDEILAHDPTAHVACEVTTTTGLVVILGEISTRHHVNYTGIARQVIRNVGNTKPEYGFDADSCGVIVSIKEQSAEIAAAVGTDEGAGDQGIMMGFACTETPDLMPLPINLAHHLCMRLAECRKQGILPYLRPDGKSQVTVEYSFGAPKRVQAVVIAAQHDPEVGSKQLWDDVAQQVIQPIVGPWMDENTDIHAKRSGSLVPGRPAADPPRRNDPLRLTWMSVFLSIQGPTMGWITCCATSSQSCLLPTSGSCWAAMTTACTRLGAPKAYSTVTWDLPSGRR